MSTRLFRFAKSDLKFAMLAKDSQNMFDVAIGAFHLQQCVEKSLLFVLSVCGVSTAHTHNIVELLSKLPSNQTVLSDDLLDGIRGFAKRLTSWESDKYKYDSIHVPLDSYLSALNLVSEMVSEIERYVNRHS